MVDLYLVLRCDFAATTSALSYDVMHLGCPFPFGLLLQNSSFARGFKIILWQRHNCEMWSLLKVRALHTVMRNQYHYSDNDANIQQGIRDNR